MIDKPDNPEIKKETLKDTEQKVKFPELEPYIQKLGLKWPVRFEVKQDEATCRIVSDPEKQDHEIWVHPDVLRKPEFYKVDTVHELCHAKLSEEVDPAFSTIYFTKESWQPENVDRKLFEQKAHMLYLAQCHVDIWVNDLRHEYFPELTKADLESFGKSVFGLAQAGHLELLQAPENVLALATTIAEYKRYNLPAPDFSSVTKRLGLDIKRVIDNISQFYSTLPKLSKNKEADLKLLESSVQEVARRLVLPISPKLVEEDKQMVWSI